MIMEKIPVNERSIPSAVISQAESGLDETLWAEVKRNLSGHMSQSNYKTWIEPLQAVALEAGCLILSGPNSFFLNWIKTHFTEEIETAIKDVASENGASAVSFIIETETPGGKKYPAGVAETTATSPPLTDQTEKAFMTFWSANNLRGHSRFTFDNFVVGDSNLYAFSAAKALANGDGLGADALFITSDHGLGKSHLSMALGQTFVDNKPKNKVFYLTAEDFTNEMTHALRHGAMDDFKNKYRRDCDVLVLEEVQFFAGKEKIQTELCFTLDCLLERGKKVVFTSPQEPKNIPRLGRPLRSRLSTALVSPIGSPDFKTRFNILLRKSKNMDLQVSPQILEYVAERVLSDVRQLESSLISLKAKSRLLGRQVDLAMAKETLAHIFNDDENGEGLTPVSIRSLVCRHFHLEPEIILSKNRSEKTTQARSLGMYLSRQITGRTLEEIGRTFGRTHSSALYAINKLEQQLKKDPKLQGKVEFFNQQIFK